MLIVDLVMAAVELDVFIGIEDFIEIYCFCFDAEISNNSFSVSYRPSSISHKSNHHVLALRSYVLNNNKASIQTHHSLTSS
jgi:hypothetical protein